MNIKFHISRYTALMIIVAVFFVFAVVKAFNYLPEIQNDTQFLQNAKNKVTDITTQDNDENNENTVNEEENIAEQDDEDNSTNESSVSDVDKLIAKANSYRENGETKKALITYLEVVNTTDNPHEYAICYDGISKIYAKQQNYEKALEKAKLAYQYEPNNARKLTLAKLYHQTGDSENEQKLLNEIMEDND